MLQLNPEIKVVLEKIDFITRFKNLSSRYNFDLDGSFESYKKDKVLTIINGLGYKVSFNKKENFFKVVNEFSSYKLQFNISLKYGVVEFIWAVWINNELQSGTGGPWGVLKLLLDEKDEDKVSKPVFRNYNDLEEILQEAFEMYEDFKREVLLIYNN